MKLIINFIFLILLLIPFHLKSQYFVSGQDRPETHWKQIKTENFNLIFPAYSEEKALEIASNLKWAYEYAWKDMHLKPEKIDVILHPDAAISNAMVVWAPSRLEMYNTPPQDNYAQDWYEQLALHEFRHVVQMNKLNQGFTKILYYVLGEQAPSAVVGLFIPSWLMEGDAVLTESNYSNAGRGRMADFNADLKAQLLEKGIYSYDKAILGSFKDYVPDQYVLGYHLVNMGTKWYGDDLWSKQFDGVAKKTYKIFPFYFTLKQNTDLSKKDFYQKSMKYLKDEWSKTSESEIKITNLNIYKGNVYSNYRYLHPVSQTSFICLKSSMNEISEFIEADTLTGKQKVLYRPGYSVFDGVDYADSLLIWTEYRYDKRWEHTKYLILMKYDIRTGLSTEISKNTKYFAPKFSHDGKKIVCVEFGKEDVCYLVILDVNGKLLQRILMPDFVLKPSWSEDDNFIIVNRLRRKMGFDFVKIDLKSGFIEPLTQSTFDYISNPVLIEDKLYYIGEHQLFSGIYCFDLKSGKTYLEYQSKYKVTDLCAKSSQLYFSDYHSDGYQAAILKPENLQLINFQNQDKNSNVILPSNAGYVPNIQKDRIEADSFKVENYNSLRHLLNIHSWSPIEIIGSTIYSNPGINIFSQNLKSTLVAGIGLNYNLNFKNPEQNYYFTYYGWPVVLSFSYSKLTSNEIIDDFSQDGHWISYNLKSRKITGRFSYPITINTGAYTWYINPSLKMKYQSIVQTDYKLPSMKMNFFGWNTRLGIARFRKMSACDLFPKYGFSLDAEWIGNNAFSKLSHDYGYSIKAYLPGIIKNHSLRVSFQKFAFQFYFPYNTDYQVNYEYLKSYNFDKYHGSTSYSINYTMPVFYPDWNLGAFMYLKRIKMNINYESYFYPKSTFYDGFNLDLILDYHLFRFYSPFESGIRISTNSLQNGMIYTFLFGVNLSGFSKEVKGFRE